MLLDEKDKGYLWDMLDASSDISEFMKGTTFSEFEKNKMLRFAVERQLLVIGEAAKHISANTKTRLENIPWGPIIGMRNLIAHEYGEILLGNIWKVATINIPSLIRELKDFV